MIVLDERLEWYQPVGAAIVLVGVAIAQGAFRRRDRPAAGRRPRRLDGRVPEARVACDAAAIDMDDPADREVGPASRR